jgi:hypothetical protein
MTEYEETIESSPSSSKTSSPKISMPKNITLREAIELGEYNPEYLSMFPDWSTLSKTIQWNYIKKALDIRERQLMQQWSEVSNILDFRLKPDLKIALKNIEINRHKVLDDREKLLLEYSA